MKETAVLELGSERNSAALPVRLPARALLRHMMALGSSGSGKTVLSKVVVEEVVRAGIPALCLDPQGDLCSLALAAPEALIERGLDPELARSFAERCDVVIFTPASDKGVALGADPLAAALAGVADSRAIDEELWTRAAATIASLLGYAADDDDGQGLVAVLDTILRELAEAGRAPTCLRALSDHLTSLDDAALSPYAKFWELKPLRQAIRKLARLEVGPRRKLFDGGVPLDIDLLLGRTTKPGLAVPKGKVRVAIIHLNSLHQQEDKEFLVAAVAERLYAWMLANPKPDPQVLFYLDEVAPYVPPVRKPQCKDSLQLLFKQARKYGVCCLMATQNPGDVDYRAMAQFGTWALGRLTTRQDLKKVEPTVKSLAPAVCDAVMAELPRLAPGQFVLLSPDHFAKPVRLQTRWLYTQHETLDEERISVLTDQRWRDRFAAMLDRSEVVPTAAVVVEPTPEPTPKPKPAPKP
ncbi:MAG: helicase HerA-like domain-containing protein, partial [Enhygromyxa sp.]